MAEFCDDDTPVAVSDDLATAQAEAWRQLARCGTWWTADQRRVIAARARHRFARRATPPWLRDTPADDPALDRAVGPMIDKIALDPGGIDRPWARSAMAQLGDDRAGQTGDGPYVELIAVVATVIMVDVLAEAVGVEPTPLPEPEPGQPSRQRPDGIGDIGAHVPVADPFPFANVARALSLVPAANQLFRTVSVPAYSAPGFGDLVWDTPLSRPQVELVASRVAALNECFY